MRTTLFGIVAVQNLAPNVTAFLELHYIAKVRGVNNTEESVLLVAYVNKPYRLWGTLGTLGTLGTVNNILPNDHFRCKLEIKQR